MKEYPILFSPEMIRALRAGRKFVTRRLDSRWDKVKAGDRLWVKEGWRPTIAHSHGMNTCDCVDVNVHYYADGEDRFFEDAQIPADWTMPKAAEKGQVTCLFMPRWASRILLEVEEDTRQERLQDITEEDAELEGVQPAVAGASRGPLDWAHVKTYRTGFVRTWRDLHSNPGERWEDNPVVRRVGRFHLVEAR